MKLPLLPCLLSLVCGLAAAWITPPAPPPQVAPPVARPVRPLPLVKSGAVPLRADHADTFARLFPEGDWKPEAEAWAADDPVGFYAWLLARGTPPGADILKVLFDAWGERNPLAALSAVENLPAGWVPIRASLYGAAVRQLLRLPGGLEAALPWMSCVSSDDIWEVPEATEWLSSLPPDQMGAFLVSHSQPGSAYQFLVESFARFWAAQDPAAALQWAGSLEPYLRRTALRQVVEGWAEGDPRGALNWVSSQPPGPLAWMADAPLQALARTDPHAAMDWALQDWNRQQFEATGKPYDTWVANDPSAALEYALSVGEPELRERCLSMYASWRSEAELGALLPTLPTLADREAVLRAVHTITDPFAPAPTPDSSEPSPAGGPAGEAFARVCGEIAQKDAPHAFDLATNLPEAHRPAALAAVLTQWTGPEGAAAVERMNDSPAKESARAFLKAHGR